MNNKNTLNDRGPTKRTAGYVGDNNRGGNAGADGSSPLLRHVPMPGKDWEERMYAQAMQQERKDLAKGGFIANLGDALAAGLGKLLPSFLPRSYALALTVLAFMFGAAYLQPLRYLPQLPSPAAYVAADIVGSATSGSEVNLLTFVEDALVVETSAIDYSLLDDLAVSYSDLWIPAGFPTE